MRIAGIALLMLGPLASAEPLDALLARMTQAAPTAASFSASLRQIDYTAVADYSAESEGTIRLKRTKSGVIGLVDYTKPSPNTVHFMGGGKAEKYLPKANTVEIYEFKKFSKSADQYLLLAFGLSGAELKKSYDVKWGGEETLRGTRTTKLELTPKDKEALKLISKVELWIPEGKTHAIQEKLYKTGGRDYLLYVYTDATLNPTLPDSAFEFKAPAGVLTRVMKE
jgi:outer membrane lipoprotein-sorting protein